MRTARRARTSRWMRCARGRARAAAPSTSSSPEVQSETLDDFRDLSPWTTIASGEAQLQLSREPSPHGHAMGMDFDFRGGGGFVVARRLLARAMPESWALALRIRGEAPANKLE